MLANANEETKKWLLYIQNEAFKMENLIRDLLFLTRSESAKNEFTILSFSNIVKEYLISLEAVFFENNIECATDIEEDLQVYGDAEKIKNLITILIDNAIKYTDGNIVINLKRESQNLHFSVYNTGIGIKKSDMKRIFDRFYRADNVKQTKEGSGLGLSIANTIVKGHKGKILVDSLEKKWARFTVVLPITKTRKTSPLVEPTKNISEERSVIELNYEEP